MPIENKHDGMSRKQYLYTVVIFWLAVMVYFCINFQRVSVPGQIFDMLQGEFSLSASAVSSLGTAFMYTYAATQLFVGLLVDKYGGMRVLTTGGLFMAVGAMIFPFAGNYWMLLIARLLVGIGCASIFLSLVKETDHLFPNKFALILGFVVLIGYIGAAIGTLPLAKLAARIGWRPCFIAAGLFSAILMILICLLWRNAVRPQIAATPLSMKPFINGFKNKYNLIQLFSYTVNYGLYYCILSVFGKKFLQDAGGLTDTMAGITNASMMILPAFCNQLVSMLTTWSGNKRRPYYIFLNTLPLISFVMATAVLIFNLPGKGYILMLSCILVSIVSAATPVTSSLSRETNPPEFTGTAVGIINFGAYIMTAFFGTGCGLILDGFGGVKDASGIVIYPVNAYTTIFGIFTVIALGTFIISLKIPETNGKNIYGK